MLVPISNQFAIQARVMVVPSRNRGAVMIVSRLPVRRAANAAVSTRPQIPAAPLHNAIGQPA